MEYGDAQSFCGVSGYLIYLFTSGVYYSVGVCVCSRQLVNDYFVSLSLCSFSPLSFSLWCSYDSMKQLCERYNRAVANIKKLVSIPYH